MAQWLTALTALAEDLNLVPGIQFSRLTVARNSSSPFWLPWALLYICKHTPTDILVHNMKNQRK